MKRLTIHLSDELSQQLKHAAAKANITHSQWLTQLIQQRLANTWPQAIRDMAGSWQEFPQQEQLRDGLGKDAPRITI